MYDLIDMKNQYNRGFWIGAISGVLTTLGMCFLIGYYLA